MTAQPIETGAPAWQPDMRKQRLAAYTVEDVLDLPSDAPRVELVNGVMLVVPSPTEDHQIASSVLWSWFHANAPEGFRAVQAIGVAVSMTHTFEPDLILRRYEGGTGSHHYVAPEQVVIAVEIVSPSTRARDRLIKPAEYAAAGIPFYWRIEQDPVHVFAYRLTAARVYELVADSAELLVLDEPFPITLPIAEITPS